MEIRVIVCKIKDLKEELRKMYEGEKDGQT